MIQTAKSKKVALVNGYDNWTLGIWAYGIIIIIIIIIVIIIIIIIIIILIHLYSAFLQDSKALFTKIRQN